jgi:hypothetical protein
MSLSFENYPDEQRIVGKILTHYGDLEYLLATCLGQVLNDRAAAIRSLFRLRGGNVRLQVASAIMRPAMDAIGLKDSYDATLGAFGYSTKIRNQYAHCHWHDGEDSGLFYTDLYKAACTSIGPLSYSVRHVDKALLESQADYLDYTRFWLWYLVSEYAFRAGRSSTNKWPAPKIIVQPPLHNPREEHPLPKNLKADDNQPQQPPLAED